MDPEYIKLKEAVQTILENPHEQPRRYYFLNIMKQVKVYSDFTSFGELALITNKRRKAKLETIEDTHFAILRKEDYKQA